MIIYKVCFDCVGRPSRVPLSNIFVLGFQFLFFLYSGFSLHRCSQTPNIQLLFYFLVVFWFSLHRCLPKPNVQLLLLFLYFYFCCTDVTERLQVLIPPIQLGGHSMGLLYVSLPVEVHDAWLQHQQEVPQHVCAPN